MADSPFFEIADGQGRVWRPSDDDATPRLVQGPFSRASESILALLSFAPNKVTLEYRRNGNFEVTQENISFFGTTYSIGHVKLKPDQDQKVRLTTGPSDYEGYIQYNLDET